MITFDACIDVQVGFVGKSKHGEFKLFLTAVWYCICSIQ